MKRYPLIALALIFTCLTTAASPRPASYLFAEYLREQAEYYRAITEYHRCIFESDDLLLRDICLYRIGACYLEGDQCSDAITILTSLASRKSELEERYPGLIRFRLAEAYYCEGQYGPAADVIAELVESPINVDIRESAIYSTVIARTQSRDITGALAFLDQHSDGWETQSTPEALRRKISEFNMIGRKKPWLAGALSAVFPGLGQVYAGRLRDGLTSFVINGIFIAGITSAIDSNHTETAWLLGFFELGWYSANIYNAMNDCHKTNHLEWESHLNDIIITHGRPFSDVDDSDL